MLVVCSGRRGGGSKCVGFCSEGWGVQGVLAFFYGEVGAHGVLAFCDRGAVGGGLRCAGVS